MSEEEKLAEAPADESTNLDAVSAEVPEAKEETKPEAEPEKAGDDAGEDEQPKKLSGAARAKLRETRLLNELAEANRRLEEATRKAPAATASDDDKPPVEADFNGDYFAFQTAKTAFEAGKAAGAAVDKRLGAREEVERKTRETEIARERDLAHAERVESAREIIADFDKTMEAMKGINVRNEVIDEIKSSENSAAIAYHLAKNPNLLAAMDHMSGRELAREMGRLEATVKLPASPRAARSDAPRQKDLVQ